MKKGDRDGALAAFYTVLADYNFGQTWDKKGWYWSPSFVPRPDRRLAREVNGIFLWIPNLSLRACVCRARREFASLCGARREKAVGTKLLEIKATRSYWNYSWGSNRVDAQPEDMEFIPMTWGAWGMDGFAKTLSKDVVPQIQSGQAKRLLGFNEPDKKEQANMPYTEALKYWPLLEKLGIPLCSPACANPLSDVDDSTQGVGGTWMRDFMREADKRKYRMDYIGVHWYGGTSPRSFKERMIEVYEAYGRRPLLISEFAVADWGAKTVSANSHSREAVLAFMKEVLPWMEKQNWIAGYAWFSFGIEEAVGTSSTLFDKEGNLTTLGRFYQSVTNENPDGDQDIR